MPLLLIQVDGLPSTNQMLYKLNYCKTITIVMNIKIMSHEQGYITKGHIHDSYVAVYHMMKVVDDGKLCGSCGLAT